MSETLEELKAIIVGKQDGDIFYDGRYLNSKLYIRHKIRNYHIHGSIENTYYDAPLYVNTKELRSLSDIERIIELMEKVESLEEELQEEQWRSGADYE